jgi:hypothetical protein
MRGVLKVLGYILVTVYFAADLVFAAVTRPLSAWIERLQILGRLNAWIAGLRPYPALALFSVPVVILEPVKRRLSRLGGTCHGRHFDDRSG